MTKHEKLMHDIKGLWESVRLGWVEMAEKSLDGQERQDLREYIDWLVDELHGLSKRLEKLDAEKPQRRKAP
jgi:hypothetical protein